VGSNPTRANHADAEHGESSPRCNRGASGCGGSTPPVRTPKETYARSQRPGREALASGIFREDVRGCSSSGRAPRLQREDAGSTPAISIGLRSVNGKHAPLVWPRCGFDSCRRLFTRPKRSSTALRRQRSLVRIQPGVPQADVAQTAKRRSATPERPVRFGPSALTFTGPWCNGSTASSNLAGPGSIPGGPAVRSLDHPERKEGRCPT
jgi:hypothetical protein